MNIEEKTLKENKTQKIDWDGLYTLTRHWKSDILFYKDDLQFLHHLINKYIIWIVKKESLKLANNIEIDLKKTQKKCESLLSNINGHLSQIAKRINHPLDYDSDKLKQEHAFLESQIASFIKDFRENRKNVFIITECIIDSDELASVLK